MHSSRFGSTYADLVSIVDQAQETEHIMPLQIVLSDYDGEAHMEFPDGIHSGLASLTNQKSARAVATIERKIDSLDIAPPLFMKIDVEGAEPEVVKGGLKTIEKDRPSIVIENFLYDLARTYAVFVLLAKLGYRMYILALEFRTGTYTYRLGCGNNYADGLEHDGAFRFAIVPLSTEHRFLMQPQLNILAVHSKRIEAISSYIASSKLATLYHARSKPSPF